jgi:hypothetical protein
LKDTKITARSIIAALLFLSVILASCVFDESVDTEPVDQVIETPDPEPTPEPVPEPVPNPVPVTHDPIPTPEPVIETPDPIPEPETIPQEEPMKEPTTETEPTVTIPETPKPVALRPLPSYHAYILDLCGALWGIPADLHGEYDKVHLTIETADGIPIPSSEVDVFSIDGILYITRTHTIDGNPAIDYYRQEGDTIALVDSVPAKPEESRAHLDSPAWLIETSVISGTEYSYLYNRDTDMIQKQGNSGGKGAFMRRYDRISGYAVLDRGVLVMTESGAFFYPVNRACGNAVSEYGRLWK